MALTDAPSRRTVARRLPKPDRRRALEILASCGVEGCSEAVMRAHGFTVDQLVELVRAGLATATAQRVRAGRETLEVATLRITDAGGGCLRGCKQSLRPIRLSDLKMMVVPMTHGTRRSAFQKAFLDAVGSAGLYEVRSYDVFMPRATLGSTFAQVGLSLTSAMRLEGHDRRATTEAAGRRATETSRRIR
jgi:hypothetical protein